MADIEILRDVIKYIKLSTPYDTQQKIAKKLGCNNAYLSSILNANEKLTDNFFNNVITTFGLSDYVDKKIWGPMKKWGDLLLPEKLADFLNEQTRLLQEQVKVLSSQQEMIGHLLKELKNKEESPDNGDSKKTRSA
jgi:chaperonin cofactor prefoldin